MKKLKSFLLLCFISLTLWSCDSYNKEVGLTLEYMYANALAELKDGDLTKAEESLQKIVSQYPYKDEAIEAQVLLIWAYYIDNDFIEAEVTIDAFLKYYVYNEYTDWVYYMKALVDYEQMENATRDQSYTKKALDEFYDIIKQHPSSVYAQDGIFKIQIIKYNLAYRSMKIGKYYLKNKNYYAAIPRYQEIITLYQDTAFTQEAMYRLVYIWLVLGEDEEAFRVASVLGYNYSDSKWYTKSLKLLKKYSKKQIKELPSARIVK
ncbi:Outer membrane protein assembly factor BamD [Candidatus Hepatincola sp. Pdp]